MHTLSYALNDYRQKIVFYKDIYWHYLRYGVGNNLCAIDVGKHEMIPQIIHYCWFGNGEYPDVIKRCMETWHTILPDYQFVLWNEEKFLPTIQQYPFAEQALKDRKWAFVADVARLHALYYCGGIYIDTDIEMIKTFDDVLQYDFFSGFEGGRYLLSAVMGAKKGNRYVKFLLDWYKRTYSVNDYYEIADTRIITKLARMALGIHMENKNFCFGNGIYFQNDYFSPSRTEGGFAITKNTHCIHHVTATWTN